MPREKLFSVTIDDCEVQTFTAGGKGGQNQNRVRSGVRIIHRASGARGEARDSRDQLVNKRAAFRRLAASPAFKRWAHERAETMIAGKSIDEVVGEMMKVENLLIEVRGPKGWEENDAEEI